MVYVVVLANFDRTPMAFTPLSLVLAFYVRGGKPTFGIAITCFAPACARQDTFPVCRAPVLIIPETLLFVCGIILTLIRRSHNAYSTGILHLIFTDADTAPLAQFPASFVEREKLRRLGQRVAATCALFHFVHTLLLKNKIPAFPLGQGASIVRTRVQ